MGEFEKTKTNRGGRGMRAAGSRVQGLWPVLVMLVVTACANKEVVTTYPAPPPPEPAPVVEEYIPSDAEFRRARLLADMLFDAKKAYDNNRLMVPAGNSAYDIYREVLQFDPGNAVALEGIEDIALRYISLAYSAINQGKYDEAEGYLGRAARLSPNLSELATARERLQQARLNRVVVHALDPAGLRAQNPEITAQLADIARQIQSSEATFLINARTDEEGRWIYKIMRDAVDGYRLRGDIAINGSPSILVNIPSGQR